MKFSRLALLACTPLPLLLALSLPADDLSFHPASNTEVSKTLKIDLEMKVDEISMTVDGQPMPEEMTAQVTENSLIVNMLVGVTEKYVETKDGKPIVLRRTFDDMKLDTEFGDETHEVEEFKEPEGKTVEFKWDEKEGAYVKAFHESDGDADALKDLEPDMDLRALLPDKKVSKGDTWEVPASMLSAVFLPGGMMVQSDAENEESLEKVRAALEAQFSEALKDFKIMCTYKGTKDDGGVTVGEIGLTFDGKLKLDLGSLIEEAIPEGEGMPEMDIKANLGMGMKGDGTLLWNQALGLMKSFEMHAETSIDIDVGMHVQMGDRTQDMAMTGQASGKVNWELVTTPK